MNFLQYINPWRCAYPEDSPINLRPRTVGTWRAWFLAWLPGHVLGYRKRVLIARAVKAREPLGMFMAIPPGYTHKVLHKVPSLACSPLDATETVAVKLMWAGDPTINASK